MAEKPSFEWPAGTRPAVRVLLNGDVQILDEIEDAPLITISGHNGVDPSAFFGRYTDEIEQLRQALRVIVEMVDDCPDAPRDPSSLPQAVKKFADAALKLARGEG